MGHSAARMEESAQSTGTVTRWVEGRDGRALDARADIVGRSIILHSRGGATGGRPPRNTQYESALYEICRRGKVAGAFERILIDSVPARRLPEEQRVLLHQPEIEALQVDDLVAAIRSRLRVFAQSDDVTGGNSTKRVRFDLKYGTASQILRLRTDPPTAAAEALLAVPHFEREFDRFSEVVYRRFNDGPFTSFRGGAAKAWEGYKSPLRARALSILDAASWTEADVGSGSILDRAIQAIEIPGNDQTRNNLVSWEGRYGPGSAGHAALLGARNDPVRRRAFESWFMDAFRVGANSGELFERLRGLAGDGYPLAAYLFFLIDIDRFAPIAPRTFDSAFARLGVDLTTSARCSWENYSAFNGALEAVRQQLVARPGLSDARHIDAHSFCWMLVRMDEELPAGGEGAGVVRYASARRRSIVSMAVNAASAAAQSGKQSMTTHKNKELHHHQRELEAIIERLIEEQQGLCALTSLPLQWHGEAEDPAMLASLDRIHSGGHYADGNLQVVCRFANMWKGAMPDDEFRRLLALTRDGSGPQAPDH